MRASPLPQQSNTRTIDATLITLGFALADDGTLVAPPGAVVTLTPIANFVRLKISIDGTAVTAVLSKAAIKITREGKP
jgi:hypothetical protein